MNGATSSVRPLAGVALASYWLPGVAQVFPPVRAALRIPNRLVSRSDVVLTFDDGPHPEGTVAVLDALDKAAVTATFFLVGEQVEQRRELAAEIAAAGHEVALHCHRHRNLLRLTPRQLADDLARAHAAIVEATGKEPRLYRPPYGIFSTAALVLARRRGWQPLLWSSDGRDWSGRASASSITRKVAHRLRGGDVILLHDADYYGAAGSWRRTVAALPHILAVVEKKGLRPALYPG